MKPQVHSQSSLFAKFLALSLGLSVAGLSPFAVQSVQATSDVWGGTTDATWATSTNWSTAPATVPGTGDTATFSESSIFTNGNTTLDLGAGVTIGALLFDSSNAAAYTIGSGAAGSQTLTLGTTGNAITVNSTVANNELINANLALSVTRTVSTPSTYYAVTNDSTTNILTLAGGISASTAGVKVLNVTGSGNITISGAITSGSGNMSLFKTGSGTLTLSGGGTFSGTGVTDGAAFASSAVFREGTTILNGGTYSNSAGELVVGGVATHGGVGTNTTLQIENGTTLNGVTWLSIGRGNGNGTAASNLTLNGSASVTSDHMSAGYNAGNTGNTPKGAITLNNTSSLSINTAGEFHLGESAGSNYTMTLNDSSTVTLNGTPSGTNAQSSAKRYIGLGGTGTLTLAGSGATFTDASTFGLMIGNQNGTGTVNVNAGTFNHTNGELIVAGSFTNGAFTGSGTVNVGGGTLNTKSLTIGRNNNTVASTLIGTVNVTSGTMNVTAGGTLVGWQGTGTTGTINVSGGTYNQNTVGGANNLNLGSFSGVSGAVNVSGGALTLQNNSSLTFSDVAATTANGTLTISGGNVTFYSNAGTTVGGTGVVDLMKTTGTGTNTINLNGGTLTANQIKATSATGTRVINFNGGTLKNAGGNSNGLGATFLASGVATTANVRNGGAIIDTNGNSMTIAQALVHSTVGGDNATDGGLTKQGTGTLTLTGTNTFTGNTTISAGTLTLGSSAASATFLADASSLYLTTGALLNLSFTSNSVMESIAGLYIDGVKQSSGTWGAVGSGATFENALITGTGLLNVSAIPEPATYAAIFGALAIGMAALRRRRAAGRV
ncbi:MAG: autotransporter-associated beta strand repeat-containing protein [Verrucomicrobia bacterium]|nr:autotransporter-associated beta strand repeat-containing protein [Verrucomicrobiota bacterium]